MSDTPMSPADAFYEALRAARAECGPVHKDSANAHFNTRYASLGAVLEAVMPVLSRHGFTVTQAPVRDGDGWALETTLRHRDGHSITGRVPLLLPHNAPNAMQALGAAITYARRYALLGLLCLSAEDDDAEACTDTTAPTTATTTTVSTPPVATPRTGKQLYAWLQSLDRERRTRIMQYLAGWARDHGHSPRMVEWDGDTVANAVAHLGFDE